MSIVSMVRRRAGRSSDSADNEAARSLPAGGAGGEAAPPGLVLEDVSGSYGRQRVVWNVSVTLPAGEAIAIVGRNGVGKTTLLRCITSTFGVRATGLVMADGVEIGHLRSDEICRQGVSLVPSDRRIFPLSVRENLMLGAGGAGHADRLDAILDQFKLLAPKLNQRGDTLSGGEQQALAVARALMGDPKYLLLDEPTEGLAPSVVDQLCDMLAAVRSAAKVGLIIVDRNNKLISQLCSSVIGMSKGRLTSTHSIEEFASDPAIRERLLTPMAAPNDSEEA